MKVARLALFVLFAVCTGAHFAQATPLLLAEKGIFLNLAPPRTE